MRFRHALTATYRGSIAFIVACPLLALVPVAFELLQHAVEVRIGLYASPAAARLHEHDAWRMGFGMVKVLALVLPGYWIVRYLAWRDPARAVRADPHALRMFAGFVTVQLAVAAIQVFALPANMAVTIAGFLVATGIGILMLAWGVAAVLGNAKVGPRASVAIMRRHVPWTFVFSLAAMLPLMVPHYAFAALAILGPKRLLWTVLIADSLLVGWLAVVMQASGYFAATRAAGKAGVALDAAEAG
ncbi:hypothetical protein [Sphingomonas sp. GC_Shp_3]|uniref:hypothetical protein n=1 Tax=Sphingomonas sp. GC_Shp_3 TaxID=2937383 RepID=UPI00226AD336|nr:hypothetical protein [Sphingomonas sp. GC_Shp_3]